MKRRVDLQVMLFRKDENNTFNFMGEIIEDEVELELQETTIVMSTEVLDAFSFEKNGITYFILKKQLESGFSQVSKKQKSRGRFVSTSYA